MNDTNPTPDSGNAATPQAPAPDQGTVQTGGDATGQSAPVQDSFTKIDPNTLPPQLLESYNNMLRDYKEKTTKLSEMSKAEVEKSLGPYRQKAQLYDQIAAEEEFVKQWNGYVQQRQAAQTQNPSENVIIDQLKNEIDTVKQHVQRTELLEVTNAFADAVNEKGEKMHPDFDSLNDIVMGSVPNEDGSREDFSLLRASIELAEGNTSQERLANGYKKAKEVYDAIFENGRKAALSRVQGKILNGTQPPSGTTPPGATYVDKRPKNAAEAFEMARRGQLVSRE